MNKYFNEKKLAIFFILSFSFIFFDLIYYFLGIDFENISSNGYAMLEVAKDLIFFIIFYLLYKKYLKDKFIDFKKNYRKYLAIAFKDWFAGFLIMIISNIIISSYIKGLGQNEEAVQSLIQATPIIAFFLTSFFAPITEEIIFRKSLQDVFNHKYIFMIMSGLIFGFLHVMSASNPWELLLIIPYGSLGFFFAKTLSDTDNIYPTIIMHAFHNAVLTLLAVII